MTFISAGFLALTGCGNTQQEGGDPGSAADAEAGQSVVYNLLRRDVTVTSGEETAQLALGKCISVSQEQLANLVVSVEWAGETKQLCGGESSPCVGNVQARIVDVAVADNPETEEDESKNEDGSAKTEEGPGVESTDVGSCNVKLGADADADADADAEGGDAEAADAE